MSPRALSMLRAIHHEPSDARRFTCGFLNAHPTVFLRDLDLLEEYGYIEQDRRGTYSITSAGERFLRDLPEPTTAPTIHSFASKEQYVPPKWNVREGSDHRYPSRGMPT